MTKDDIRRELEAHGFVTGVAQLDLMTVAQDAYSEIWEPSRHQQMDHTAALAHALATVFDYITENGIEVGR